MVSFSCAAKPTRFYSDGTVWTQSSRRLLSAPFFPGSSSSAGKHPEARRLARMAERKRWVPSDQAKNLLETIFTADSFPTCATCRPHPPHLPHPVIPGFFDTKRVSRHDPLTRDGPAVCHSGIRSLLPRSPATLVKQPNLFAAQALAPPEHVDCMRTSRSKNPPRHTVHSHMPQIAPRPTRPSSIIVPAVCPPYDINDAPLKLVSPQLVLDSTATGLPSPVTNTIKERGR